MQTYTRSIVLRVFALIDCKPNIFDDANDNDVDDDDEIDESKYEFDSAVDATLIEKCCIDTCLVPAAIEMKKKPHRMSQMNM